MKILIVLALSAAAAVTASHPPQSAGAAPVPNDYANPAAWLCRPGRQDACAVDLTTTVVAADGTLRREAFTADPNAPIDCFYVYPTVSSDPGPISDMIPDAPERAAVKAQFARFASVCRPYAPVYRQVTLAGLRTAMAGGTADITLARSVGYSDVRDAWNYYLAHDNQGRGVVLIGHSQGSFVLMELLRNEIDGKPVQSKLVSAILAGTTLSVPKGRDMGGTLQHIPLCSSASATGCVIVYSSYWAQSPPPADSLFGRVTNPGLEAACVNAAAPGGGSGELHAYFTTGSREWLPGARIDTPFVSVPGLLSARCANKDGANYLEVTVRSDPSDRRSRELGGQLSPQWGLHQIDISLEQGNLIDVVRAESLHRGNRLHQE